METAESAFAPTEPAETLSDCVSWLLCSATIVGKCIVWWFVISLLAKFDFIARSLDVLQESGKIARPNELLVLGLLTVQRWLLRLLCAAFGSPSVRDCILQMRVPALQFVFVFCLAELGGHELN